MEISYTYRNIEYLPSNTFGFKIHISATFQNYKEILDIVKTYLEKKRIAYKFIENEEDIYKVFSVHEIAAECGKFITIYPSQTIILTVLEDLYQLLRYKDGIYILSDRPYKDSNLVFYRFGLLHDSTNVYKDGIPTLVNLNGEEWQDYPKPYFDLPSWIEDIQPPQEENNESYLGSHYEVAEVLHQSGGGNVYHGDDKKFNTSVILKEVRPYILSFYDLEKKELREKEYEISVELQKRNVKQLIRPIEKADEWINSYYIYHYISGESLADFCKEYGINSYSRGHKHKNLKLFKSFLDVVTLLVDTLNYFHENDLILNDIHPDNFVVDENNTVSFIDLENSYFYGDKPFVGITSRISLKKWNNLDGKLSDFRKLGNMILFLLARLTISESSQTEPKILDRLLRAYGIDSNLSDFLIYLLYEDIDQAGVSSWLKSLYARKVDIEEILPEVTLLENSSISFIDRVRKWCPSFSKYESYLQSSDLLMESEDVIFKFLNAEQNLGIGGLSGVIVLLYSRGFHELAIDGVNILLNRLEETEDGLQVPIEGGFFSPYIENGLSGVIQMLYYINPERYRHLILELRKTLYVEFAQYEGYSQGALGIADTLLLTVNYRNSKKLEQCIKSLILNSLIYHEERKLSQDELIEVLVHYSKVYSS